MPKNRRLPWINYDVKRNAAFRRAKSVEKLQMKLRTENYRGGGGGGGVLNVLHSSKRTLLFQGIWLMIEMTSTRNLGPVS